MLIRRLLEARRAIDSGRRREGLVIYTELMRSVRPEDALAPQLYNDVARLAAQEGKRARSDALFERAAWLAGFGELSGEDDPERRYVQLRQRLGEVAEAASARHQREAELRGRLPELLDWLAAPGQAAVSVVIPTKDRAEVLRTCLAQLAAGRVPADRLEVLVVDDGSQDHTADVVATASLPRLQRIAMPSNRGPAAARNLAIEAATAPLLLFLNDDTIGGRELVAEHVISHAAVADPGVAVLGRVDWDPAVGITPLMRLLDSDGLCFAYDHIADAEDATWRHGYTCNLSFDRAWLRRRGRFDEALPSAAGEDIELCYRLERDHQLRIVYNPRAHGLHRHAITLERFAARQFRVGKACAHIANKHPELRNTLLHSLRVDAAVRDDAGSDESFLAATLALIQRYERIDDAGTISGLRLDGQPLRDALRADLTTLYRFYLHQHLNRGLLAGGGRPAQEAAA